MTMNTLKILTVRIQVKSLIYLALVIAYISFSIFLFFQWVNPSLDGRTDQHIAADSGTYMYFADSLRDGTGSPLILAPLFSFPNTLLFPTLIAFALKNTLTIVIFNYAIFFFSVILLKNSFNLSGWMFIALMCINATTTISLLSVNKEMIDVLTISIFCFALRRRHISLLVPAFALALFNRYEIAVVMVVFLFVTSKLYPWRQRRLLTLVMLSIALSVALPLTASHAISERFEEAKNGHLVAFLDSLEMHYLYALSVIPKIAENLFAELINVQKLQAYLDFQDIANTYIVFFNNFASAIVLGLLVYKRSFSIKSDPIYFVAIGWIIMAIALVIQPRYFYFAYTMLCIQAAQIRGSQVAQNVSFRELGEP